MHHRSHDEGLFIHGGEGCLHLEGSASGGMGSALRRGMGSALRRGMGSALRRGRAIHPQESTPAGVSRGGWVCIQVGLADPSQDTWDTTGYGQQAGSTHPTGMHSY